MRHAETVYNVRGLASGDPLNEDCVLSERGEEQAEALGCELAAVPFELCVTSEFVRTRQTADLVLAGRAVPRLELGDLNELDVGELEGKPVAEVEAWIASNGGLDAVPPGGESLTQALVRWRRAYETVVARPEEPILVIAHQTPLAALFQALALEHLEDGLVRNATAYPVTRAALARAIPLLAL